MDEQTSPFRCVECGEWLAYLSDGIYMCDNPDCESPNIVDDDPER